MNSSAALMSEAKGHLRSGRFGEARRILDQIVHSGIDGPEPLMLLAVAAQKVGDTAASLRALDGVLATEPRIVPAWLLKGDLLAASGDTAAAREAYERALTEARPQQSLPDEVKRRLAAAAQWIATDERTRVAQLKAQFAATEAGQHPASRRFEQSLDIIFEAKNIYVQRPHVYFFPGLPVIQLFEREAFEWAAALESKTDAIRAELEALLEDKGLFAAHIPADRPTRSGEHDEMAGNAGWSTLHLWQGGGPVEQNARRCPATMAALEGVPLPHFSKRVPSAPAVMFSMLRAGARIPPHTGSTNVRLICHLPLIVPPRCALRVGNETRAWEPGKLLIFDDTIEHEAWNESDRDRIVLIFDIWRPELTAPERDAVTAFFKVLQATRGEPS